MACREGGWSHGAAGGAWCSNPQGNSSTPPLANTFSCTPLKEHFFQPLCHLVILTNISLSVPAPSTSVRSIPMVAGRTYEIVVGAGGLGAGADGGNSLFRDTVTGTVFLTATGGRGGNAATRLGGLGGNCTFGGGVTWVGWGMGGEARGGQGDRYVRGGGGCV